MDGDDTTIAALAFEVLFQDGAVLIRPYKIADVPNPPSVVESYDEAVNGIGDELRRLHREGVPLGTLPPDAPARSLAGGELWTAIVRLTAAERSAVELAIRNRVRLD